MQLAVQFHIKATAAPNFVQNKEQTAILAMNYQVVVGVDKPKPVSTSQYLLACTCTTVQTVFLWECVPAVWQLRDVCGAQTPKLASQLEAVLVSFHIHVMLIVDFSLIVAPVDAKRDVVGVKNQALVLMLQPQLVFWHIPVLQLQIKTVEVLMVVLLLEECFW